MKITHRCPKCGHGEVLHVPSPMDSNFDRLALGGRRSVLLDVESGKLEAYMCMSCGFVELYVSEPRTEDLTQLPGATVLTTPPDDGPYR